MTYVGKNGKVVIVNDVKVCGVKEVQIHAFLTSSLGGGTWSGSLLGNVILGREISW